MAAVYSGGRGALVVLRSCSPVPSGQFEVLLVVCLSSEKLGSFVGSTLGLLGSMDLDIRGR